MTQKLYIGTKIVAGTPMTRLEYNNYRGWTPPEGEDQSVAGYLVEYKDGGKPNHPNHEGYISWSPADVFEQSYSDTQQMSFAGALFALNEGTAVQRAGWNGKGMFIFYVGPNQTVVLQPPLSNYFELHKIIDLGPYLMMKTADDKLVPWLASQTDILAHDWSIVQITD